MEHPPLFPPGFHPLVASDFPNHFLSHFPTSSSRPDLIAHLNNYLTELKSLGIKFELWIDGSFSTNKEDPSDVDIVAFASVADVNSLDLPGKLRFRRLFDRASIKLSYKCDVLFSPLEDINMRSYWRGWFGYDRNENPKGIPTLEVAP